MRQKLAVYSVLTFVLALYSFFYLDLAIAEFFHARTGDAVWVIFDHLTEAGEGSYWIVIPAIIYFFYRYFPDKYQAIAPALFKNRVQRMYTGAFIALTAFWSGLLVNLLKLLFARYRPVEYFQFEHYGMSWFDYGYRMASFPSGHSATALSVAMALALLFTRYRYIILVAGTLILFSRVVLTEHYLSDVVIGGYVGVLTTLYLFQSYYLKKVKNTSRDLP